MSKMNDIALQLDERAVELGFADHLEAMANGYDWGVGEDGAAFLFNVEDEQEKAHEAWLKERDEVLGGLLNLMVHNAYDYNTVIKAYNFIKEQCHD